MFNIPLPNMDSTYCFCSLSMCLYGVPGHLGAPLQPVEYLWNECVYCIVLYCHLHNTLSFLPSTSFLTLSVLLTSGFCADHHFKLLIDQLSSLIQFEHDKSHSCTISWRVAVASLLIIILYNVSMLQMSALC